MNTITKDDFLTMVRLQQLEVITQNQLSQNTKVLKSYMEKALTEELSDIEKADANMMVEEVASFDKWEVINNDFTKSICYTRPEQVEWEEFEKGEFGEIIKAKGGVYKPTGENKKLGRVGQKYGEKEEKDEEDKIAFEKERRRYEAGVKKDDAIWLANKKEGEEKKSFQADWKSKDGVISTELKNHKLSIKKVNSGEYELSINGKVGGSYTSLEGAKNTVHAVFNRDDPKESKVYQRWMENK